MSPTSSNSDLPDPSAAPGPKVAKRPGFFGARNALKSPKDALQPELAPPPPLPPKRRRRSTLSRISGVVTFLLALMIVAGVGLVEGKRKLAAPGPLAQDKVVLIPRGTDTPSIIAILEKEGVIDSFWWMQTILALEGERSRLKAGEYDFKQGASLESVIATIVSGHAILHNFTIPEGWTIDQIVEKLRADELLTGDIRTLPAEGSLMPNTYKFSRGETRAQQIAKMEVQDKKVVAEVWANRASNLPLANPAQMVTLASIVEKETGKVDERPRVAAVFLNRLAKHIRLQSDPTVVYGLVGGKATLGHLITRAELTKRTPYNTYQIDGLPPGPIGNPGKAALEAVANPDQTKELYFVADGTGGHVFAETLKQHNLNVLHWRSLQKQNQDLKDQLAPDASQSVAPASPSDQHGEIDVPDKAFGELPERVIVVEGGHDAISRAAAMLAARLAKTMPEALPKTAADAQPDPPAGGTMLADWQDLNQLGIVVKGVNDSEVMNGGDGAALPEESTIAGADLSDFKPVRPTAAQIKAMQAIVVPPGAAKPTVGQGGPLPAHVLAFDASEGTKLDPLLNQNFDLNFAKTIPKMPVE